MMRHSLNRKRKIDPSSFLGKERNAASREAVAAAGSVNSTVAIAKDKHSRARLMDILLNASHILLALFTFLYIASCIFFGGFYAGELHTLAIVLLLSFLVLLVAIPIVFVLILRIHRYTAPHLIRWILYLATIAISVISFSILGAGAFLLTAALVSAATLALDIVRISLLSPSRKKRIDRKYKVIVASSAVLICVAAALLSGIGVMPLYGDGAFVETSSLKRSVKYSLTEDGEVMLEKVMLTAYDALGIRTDVSYEVLDTVTIGGKEYKVSAIGKEAFVGVRSFDSVHLPDGITVMAGAFERSGISDLLVDGATLVLEDGLAGSRVSAVSFTKQSTPISLTLGEGATLSEGLSVSVDRENLDALRLSCPEIAAAIIPAVSENEVFITYNISLPDGDVGIDSYVNSGIYTLGEGGNYSFELPFAEMLTESDAYGEVWEHRTDDGRTFRLTEFTVNGRPLEHISGSVTASVSMNVSAVWEEIFTVTADLTSIGGEKVLIDEFTKDMSVYNLDTGYKNALHPGYTSKSWKILSGPDEGVTVSSLTELSANYVIEPVWTLDAPVVSMYNIDITYDAYGHTLTPSVVHEIGSLLSYSYSWSKGGVRLDATAGLISLKNVADSGDYTFTVTVTDSDGKTATAAVSSTVNIRKAPLNITANALGHTYGEEETPLSYNVEGLLQSDGLTGELSREAGDNAGEYRINQGTLTAGDNYSISFIPATYTVAKANYDMSGVSISGDSLVYDGLSHSLEISGELPTGLDGITLGVSYEGSIRDAGTVTVTAIFSTLSANYNIPDPISADLTVTPRPISITATAETVTFGEKPRLEYYCEGLVSGDLFTGSLSAEGFADDFDGYFTAGEHSITVGTLSAGGNYHLESFTSAILTVEKAEYDLSGIGFEPLEVVFDGASHHPALSGTLPTGLDGIPLTVTYEGSATHVNEGEVAVIAVFGSESENYNLPDNLTSTVRILKRAVTVSANAVNVTYGEELPPLTYGVEGIVDMSHLTGSLNREALNSAGSYLISQGSLNIAEGYTEDYELTYVGAVYVINKAVYDMSGITFSDLTVVYDGLTHSLAVSGTLPTGLDGITLKVDYVGSLRDVGKTEVEAIFSTVSGNYEVPEAMTATLTVTKKALSITANGVEVVYGEEGYANSELTYTQAGLVEGDVISGALIRELGDGAGEYKISRGTLDAGDNYELTFFGASYVIKKATYDMSGIEFNSITPIYNKQQQRPEITGTLPTGLDGVQVTVEYFGSAMQVSEGEVTVTARFTGSENYEPIGDMTATVTVKPSTIHLTARELKVPYGKAVSTADLEFINGGGLYGGDIISGKPAFEGNYDSHGNLILGEYAITVGTLDAGDNYEIDFTEGKLIVVKAVYDMSGVTFLDATFAYNGEKQYPTVGGTLPTGLDGVQVTVSYEGGATDVSEGEVTVTAKFTGSENYEPISDMTATVRITPAEYEMDGVTFLDKAFNYNGEKQYPTVGGTLPTGLDGVQVTVSYEGGATDVSESGATVTAVFATESENYNTPEPMTATVTILKQTVEVPTVDSDSLDYSGEAVTFLADDPEGRYTVEGGTATELGIHTATVTLTDPDNYAWSDPDFDGRVVWEFTNLCSA